MKDKRYFPRWQVNNRVFYKLDNDDDFRECQSRDLSCAGACLFTEEDIPTDRQVKLTIHLSSGTSVEVEGRILRSDPIEGGHLAGVAFTNIGQKSQDTILKYAFEIKKEDLVKHWFKGWKKTPAS